MKVILKESQLLRLFEVIYNGQDVTEFANNYVFWSGEGDDSELAMKYKMFISDEINKILRLTPIKTSEWDVYLMT